MIIFNCSAQYLVVKVYDDVVYAASIERVIVPTRNFAMQIPIALSVRKAASYAIVCFFNDIWQSASFRLILERSNEIWRKRESRGKRRESKKLACYFLPEMSGKLIVAGFERLSHVSFIWCIFSFVTKSSLLQCFRCQCQCHMTVWSFGRWAQHQW